MLFGNAQNVGKHTYVLYEASELLPYYTTHYLIDNIDVRLDNVRDDDV